jgi:predicted alpha/beta-hydrolase family hydrolase
MNEFLTAGPVDAKSHMLLAHGAGAPMTSPFLETMTRLLNDRGLRASRFEFDYMAARRQGGKRRPPPKAETLIGEYERAAEAVSRGLPPGQRLLIGGKSMGGRVASLCADTLFASDRIAGLVCLGYPFHPPGKPAQLRTSHLADLRCPALIVQGERDPFGTREEVEDYKLAPAMEIHWAADGDHDLGPRGGKGFTRAGNLAAAADAIAAFAQRLATR